MGKLIASVFGYHTNPFHKYRRLMYWLPKMKNTNPFPIPLELPDDRIELAKLVIKRMAVDLQNRVQIFEVRLCKILQFFSFKYCDLTVFIVRSELCI